MSLGFLVICAVLAFVIMRVYQTRPGDKENQVYCGKCGEDRPYAIFCPKCGSTTSLKPRCGCGSYYNPVRDGGDYCVQCGAQLPTSVSNRASDK